MEGSLWIVLFTVLVLTIDKSSSNPENEGLDSYPSTKCFKTVSQLKGRLVGENEYTADCSKSYPDRDSFCFKICMLRSYYMIKTNKIPPRGEENDESDETWLKNEEKTQAFNFTADGDSIVNELLRNSYLIKIDEDREWMENDAKFQEIYESMQNRAKKCETMSIVIPKEEHPCKLFTPETKEKMETLKDCVEEVLNCDA